MRIGIDVRYLSHGLIGGIHTYLQYFVPELIELAAEHQIVLYADTKRPFELHDLPPHVTVRYLPWSNPASSIVNDLLMWRSMARDTLDVVHFPANYGFGPPGARVVLTLHDAITIMPLRETLRSEGQRRTLYSQAMIVYLNLCSKLAVRRADMLVTVSNHARQDILRYCTFNPDRIIAVPHAPAPDMHRIDDQAILDDVRRRHAIGRPFVLADALKNPGVLVRAWRRLPADLRNRFQIVFFSRHATPLPVVEEAVAEGAAQLLIRPSRADLIALYNTAEVFVFPSWYEGFGIPILEAMACGAPVIISDNGPMPEVAGGAALLMHVEDDAALAVHLTRLLTEPEFAGRQRERGFARAAEFSWRKTAARILESYEAAVRLPVPHAPGLTSDDAKRT
ncbi:MAG TPA: glycosyltransferase family 1 protein [Roseiflexaceae bacterium]|nr:glycosyltransferase family 1 protein [Roseiflexaceae bacterium]HMP39245.1 glycosyltransferase family 1 protein [Roseiflexaceae bacterium]